LYTTVLTEDEIVEIEAAVKDFKALNIPRGMINPTTFRLSQGLASKLQAITNEVYDGHGFHRLCGINPRLYTEEERLLAFAGITSYIADQRSRSIDHVRDRTFANPNGEQLKPSEQSVAMGFHTDVDQGDIVGLFTQSVPLEGGEQYIASMASVYNDLAKTDPGVLKTLAKDWYWEIAFRPAAGQESLRTYERPLIAYEDSRLQVNFAKTFIGGSPIYPLSPNAPALTEEQLHALVAIQDSAKRTCLRIDPQPGDMLLINNYALLHARATFTDSLDDEWKQRNVMRVWLRHSTKGWKSASALMRRLDEIFDLPPEQQGLFTGEEWQGLSREMRVKDMGIIETTCHD